MLTDDISRGQVGGDESNSLPALRLLADHRLNRQFGGAQLQQKSIFIDFI